MKSFWLWCGRANWPLADQIWDECESRTYTNPRSHQVWASFEGIKHSPCTSIHSVWNLRFKSGEAKAKRLNNGKMGNWSRCAHSVINSSTQKYCWKSQRTEALIWGCWACTFYDLDGSDGSRWESSRAICQVASPTSAQLAPDLVLLGVWGTQTTWSTLVLACFWWSGTTWVDRQKTAGIDFTPLVIDCPWPQSTAPNRLRGADLGWPICCKAWPENLGPGVLVWTCAPASTCWFEITRKSSSLWVPSGFPYLNGSNYSLCWTNPYKIIQVS